MGLRIVVSRFLNKTVLYSIILILVFSVLFVKIANLKSRVIFLEKENMELSYRQLTTDQYCTVLYGLHERMYDTLMVFVDALEASGFFIKDRPKSYELLSFPWLNDFITLVK